MEPSGVYACFLLCVWTWIWIGTSGHTGQGKTRILDIAGGLLANLGARVVYRFSVFDAISVSCDGRYESYLEYEVKLGIAQAPARCRNCIVPLDLTCMNIIILNPLCRVPLVDNHLNDNGSCKTWIAT